MGGCRKGLHGRYADRCSSFNVMSAIEAMTMIETQATWTIERIALLKNRMNAGLSCGQIAQELGVTRNAVIGKANRLGLSRLKHAFAGLQETNTRKRARK